tara:strand:+ start:146 stop:2092 length:1947 start_codon:yes stop_codon:yes gene_type:complete
MSPAETQLLARWREQGDAEAFQKLVARHTGMVYGTCRRILRNATAAEDATQVCFLKLAEMPAAVKTSLPGWLHTVATRCSLEMLRSEARRRNRETGYAQESADLVEPAWDEISPIIDELIHALPEKLKYPVLRHFHEGQTHLAIARELGISRAAVSQRIKRAVETLRSGLQRRGIVHPTAVLSTLFAAHLADAVPPALMAALGNIALKGPALSVSASFGAATSLWGGMLKAAGIGLCLVLGGLALFTFKGREDGGGEKVVMTQEKGSETPDTSAARETPGNGGGRLDQRESRGVDMGESRGVPENDLTRAISANLAMENEGVSAVSDSPNLSRSELVTKTEPGRIECTIERHDLLGPLPGEAIRVELQQVPEDPSSPPLQRGIERVHSLENTGLVNFDGLPLGSYEVTATEGTRWDSVVVALTAKEPHVETTLSLSEFEVAPTMEIGTLLFPDDREITYPEPSYGGTPLDYWSPNLEEEGHGAPVRNVPNEQARIISRGRPVSSSNTKDPYADIGRLSDSKKDYSKENVIVLPPGPQWVQIHLEADYRITAVIVWHYYEDQRVYQDVAVRVSSRPDGKDGTMLYNNDHDNSLGMGVGTDREYVEKYTGRYIDGKDAVGRYVRCFSNGNTANNNNHYIEVEVWGVPYNH